MGQRLIGVSRRVLHHAYHLGLAWQITGEKKYAERLAADALAAAAFPDWNPEVFPDTSELAHALGIGFDWCYDAWSDEQRSRIRNAIVERALKPARIAYQNAATQPAGWPTATDDTNLVCNAGISVAALAVADSHPELTADLLSQASSSAPRALANYAPDGGWFDGPGYWGYNTIYTVVLLASLESALGTDFGLSDLPGLSQTGFFPIHMAGPIGRTFNFGDGKDGLIRSAPLFWLARRFNQPAFARYQRDAASPHPLDLVWYDPAAANAAIPREPIDRHFRGPEIVTLRSAWPDNESFVSTTNRALFVAFKGGGARSDHGHLDLGSFVFDALGVRWAADLGAEDYNAVGYFGGQRWDYYMTRAESHNTLVIQPDSAPDQNPTARAPITRFVSRPAEAFAIADLSEAYTPHAKRVQRGIALHDQRRRVLIQDEIEIEKPADVHWFMQTTAKIEARGRDATLTYGRERLWAAILSPADASFTVSQPLPLPSSPHPKDQTSIGGRKLTIHIPKARTTRLAVLLLPLEAETKPPEPDAVPVKPLADWN